MKTVMRVHHVTRCTVNGTRIPNKLVLARCGCGVASFGPDRLAAMDAWTEHVINARASRIFKMAEASS